MHRFRITAWSIFVIKPICSEQTAVTGNMDREPYEEDQVVCMTRLRYWQKQTVQEIPHVAHGYVVLGHYVSINEQGFFQSYELNEKEIEMH